MVKRTKMSKLGSRDGKRQEVPALLVAAQGGGPAVTTASIGTDVAVLRGTHYPSFWV